jgi:anti-anti-sigma factor
MKFIVTDLGIAVAASVDSSILQENVPLMRTRLSQLLEEQKIWLIIDLSKANYLSSMAVAVIVDIKMTANRLNGDLVLACPNHLIKNLLDITNVSRKIKSYDTIDEARRALEETKKGKETV